LRNVSLTQRRGDAKEGQSDGLGVSACALLLCIVSGYGSAQAPESVYFRTNLAGYLPADSKVAVVFSNQDLKGGFSIIEIETGKKALSGKLTPSIATGFAPFRNFYTIDFSSVTKEGRYQIILTQTKTQSAAISIDKNSYRSAPDQLLGFMRQQRCGYNPFFDEVCHQLDGRMMGGIVADSTYTDARGGWHDAGDQLKYLITGSNATARMIAAWQLFPFAFADQVNALGQPGSNGIADVLDEAKWGLDWILKLYPQNGVLIHQVGDDRDHIGWKLPKNDPSNYGWGKNSYRVAYVATGTPQGLGKYKSEATGVANLAGRSAAALALGQQVWKKNGDDAFALKCLNIATELYAMAKEQEGYQQGNSYGAPYRYNEDTWTDDMEWAAAELYRSTGREGYLADAKHYANLTGELSWIQNDTTAHYQRYPFLNYAHFALYDLVDESFKKKISTWYKNGIEKTLVRANKNVYHNGVPFIWCSSNLTVDLALQIMLYERMTADQQFHSYLTSMRDWLLGTNPWGTSMFMNIPSQGPYPKDVHTSTWQLTKTEVPGGLVDGPIYTKIFQSLKGLTLTHADAYSAFQGEHVVYHDDIGDYSTNEPTMDGTACAIMLMAYLASESSR
jgi:endoglucanase